MRRVLIVVCLLQLVLTMCPGWAREDRTTAVSVRIVPTGFTDSAGPVIALTDPAGHFAVVLTNTGAQPLRLWRESCSQGYSNLSFEATDQVGIRTAVTKKPIGWEKNHPVWMVVPPGDHMVIDVTFDAAIWRNTPLPGPGQHRAVTLRAIYESADGADAKSNKVWTGKAASPETIYTIFR